MLAGRDPTAANGMLWQKTFRDLLGLPKAKVAYGDVFPPGSMDLPAELPGSRAGCLVWADLLGAGCWRYGRGSKPPLAKELSIDDWRRKLGETLMDDSRCLPLRLEGTTLVIGRVNGGNTLYLDQVNQAIEYNLVRYENITEEEFRNILGYSICEHCQQSRPDVQMKTSTRCWDCWTG